MKYLSINLAKKCHLYVGNYKTSVLKNQKTSTEGYHVNGLEDWTKLRTKKPVPQKWFRDWTQS